MTHGPTDTTLEHVEDLSLIVRRVLPLVRWEDDDGAHSIELEGLRAVIGSAASARVCIHDARASRVHAELRVEDDGIWIRDLGSRNGTYVQGIRIRDACLPVGGGVVRIGPVALHVNFVNESNVRLWPAERLGPLVGRSRVMRALFMDLIEVAQSDAPALILGETGTGKELVARQIHEKSRRADKDFLVIDCAALPENLMEAELFGAARGAFTGATNDRVGAIESADGGTVFLDEIGELPLALQAKLLRALESKTVRRIGESTHRPVDVRFVAATHRDLVKMTAENRFREDLYFRIAVLPLHVPPLRERGGDLALLLAELLGHEPSLDADVLSTLRAYVWPGNVRELKNFVERLRVLGPARALERLLGDDAEPSSPFASSHEVDIDIPFKELRERWINHLEQSYLTALIARHGRHSGVLADTAGLDRSYVHRLLKKHKL